MPNRTRTVALPDNTTHTYTSGCGRLHLQMTLAQALRASRPGEDAKDAVAELVAVPAVAVQLAALDLGHVRDELRGSGAWDDAELADDAKNLRRWVWMAVCDIRENPAETRDEAAL
jgi:hypothetical protein